VEVFKSNSETDLKERKDLRLGGDIGRDIDGLQQTNNKQQKQRRADSVVISARKSVIRASVKRTAKIRY
jgi:hypothetical protein